MYQKKHLLIIEEEPEIIEWIERILEYKYKITPALNSEMALQYVSHQEFYEFDLIVLDLLLPNISNGIKRKAEGYRVIETLEQYKCEPPVIVISSVLNDEDRKRLNRPWIRSILDKPFPISNFEQFIALILIESDLKDIVIDPNRWLDTQHDLLEGQAPRDMIMMGEDQRVYDLIRAIQHGMVT